MLISDLSELQKGHLAWRLDHKTYVGYITAGRIARGEFGDRDLIEVFKKAGRTSHSAKIHARKVINYPTPHITNQIKGNGDSRHLELLAQHQQKKINAPSANL